MRRILYSLVVVVLLLVAGAVSAPYLISSQAVKDAFEARLVQWTGRVVTLRGEPVITLFPYLSVKLKDVSVAGQEGATPLVSMEAMKGLIRILPLLAGRIEIARFRFDRPRFHYAIDNAGRANWSIGGGGRHAINLTDLRLGELTIVEGAVSYADERSSVAEEFTALNLRVTWPRPDRPAKANGNLVWRGQVVNLTAEADDPLAMSLKTRSAVRIAVNSAPMRLNLDGQALFADIGHFEGKITVSFPSLRGFLEWIGMPITPGSTLGAGRFDADAKISGPSGSFTGATVELDGNVAEGAGAIDFGLQTPFLQGTLHLENLDVTAYLEAMAHSQQPSDWRLRPIDVSRLGMADIDLRLSTGRLVAGALTLGQTAGSIVSKEGRLSIGIGEAELYGGRMEGSVTIATEDETTQIQAFVNTDDVAINDLLSAVFGAGPITGALTMKAELSSHGRLIGQMVRNLAGSVTAGMDSGSVDGLDLNTRLSSAIAADGSPSQGGSTNFEGFNAALTLEAGIVAADTLTLTSGDTALMLSGATDLVEQSLNMRGEARLVVQDGAESVIPLRLEGTWQTPQLAIDFPPGPNDEPTKPPQKQSDKNDSKRNSPAQ